MLLAAAEAGRPVREATPGEVKSAVAGYGAADKEQVARMVQLVLGMPVLPTPDDAADALAIAVCIANGLGQVGRSSRPGGAGVLDRGAIAPIDRGGLAVRAGRARGARPRVEGEAPGVGVLSVSGR